MGVFDFLKKKSSDVPTAPTSAPMPPASTPMNPGLDLPELPSFDAPMPMQQNTGMGDLPPLPAFDAPDALAMPPAFDMSFQPPEMPAAIPTTAAPVAPPAPIKPAAAKVTPATSAPTPAADEEPSLDLDVKTPFGPVFCDVETYRVILSNLNYVKDEVTQLQTFAQNSTTLHAKSQTSFDSFHNSLSSMAKKLLMAEAKLFRD